MPVIIGAMQATEAIKILIGSMDVSKELISIDIWRNVYEHFKIKRRTGCPTCNGHYQYLETRFDLKATSLCGQRRAVQILDMNIGNIDLKKTSKCLHAYRNVFLNDYYLSFDLNAHQIVIFPDGRTIIKNTVDEIEANQIYKSNIAPLLISVT